MKGQFVLDTYESNIERNIYADKSSLILEWLLTIGIQKKEFSLREVTRDRAVSVGLVQGVFRTLVLKGYLQSSGLRTAKKFSVKKPGALLNEWLDSYSVVKKCKMKNYRSGFQNRKQILNALEKSNLHQNVALALHSAAEVLGCKNTNLQTLEFYLIDRNVRQQIEALLQLEPQERGYEVLLIEPYYKSMLNFDIELQRKEHKMDDTSLFYSLPLLTFLDLYHFPLRGQEQAEFMVQRLDELKRI